MKEMNWVDQINEEIKCNCPSVAYEKEQWKKHSIYKVPSPVTDLNKKAYKPQAVSFGPYHYGEEHLKAMEEHKHRALLHFLKRCMFPMELLYKRMDQVVQELRDSYKPLDPIWLCDTPRFLQMMILDGCFMLEIFKANDCVPDDYADNDPVFGQHGKLHVMPYIKRDMLMLENQLPMTVLHILVEVETGMMQENYELLNEKILKLLNPSTPLNLVRSMGKCMHILDLFRKSLIQQGPTHLTRMPKPPKIESLNLEAGEDIIRSAIELHEAGVRFQKSRTQSLGDVSFDNNGVLRLPTLVVDDTTEYMLLNLIAFERLHVGAGNEVTSYIFFMDTIIDSNMDVALLNRVGIIINAIGSDKSVAKLFNSLSRDITLDPLGELDVVRMSLSNYCKRPWNRWRANLIHTYFRNPWAIVSLLAAIFLFALTIVSTVFTVKQYY